MEQKKLDQPWAVALLFGLCWGVYFTSYLGRLNYSAAMTQLLEGDVLSRSQAGWVSTVFFICYASGQLLNGLLGDHLQPKTMMLWGLLLSALMNLFMGLSSSFGLMILIWGVNGYAQSMIWPPIVTLFTVMLQRPTVLKCFTNLASTVALGTLFSYFLSAMLLQWVGWQWVFLVPGLLLIGVALAFALLFPKVERHRAQFGILEPPPPEEPSPSPKEVGKRAPLLPLLLSPALLIMALPVFIHGVLKDGLTAWVPTYFSDNFGAGAVTAVLVSMVLPVVNLAGAYLAQRLHSRIPGELRCASVFFLAAFLCLGGIWLLGDSSLPLCLLLLSLSSAAMLAVNTIFISYVPIRYGKVGRSASVSGFLNATAYLGAAVSSGGIGVIVGTLGWTAAMLSFVLLTACALAICFFGDKKAKA